jgi:hypothetical protein
MTFLSFLSKADFVASVVVDATVLFVSFLAYRRTSMPAFAFLIWGSLLGIILEMGIHLRTPTSPDDAVSFHEWYRVGFFASSILWGIGIFQLVRYVQREFERQPPPNKSPEPTAVTPSVPHSRSTP